MTNKEKQGITDLVSLIDYVINYSDESAKTKENANVGLGLLTCIFYFDSEGKCIGFDEDLFSAFEKIRQGAKNEKVPFDSKVN